ncbi:Hsp33 family molecular chaperone HslO, partial [Klebsiella pneumoniae]
DDLDIRGAVVRLGPVWQALQAGRSYSAPVARLLGEITLATTLVGSQLKQLGRLTLQMRGDGPVSLLIVDCDDQLRLKGMARA